MLSAARTPRLHRILLVMITSALALACFLGYWLQREYAAEKAQLQKDIRQLVTDAKSRITDSLIMETLIRPLELKLKTVSRSRVATTPEDTLQIRDTGTFIYSVHSARPGSPLDVRLRIMHDSGALNSRQGRFPAEPFPMMDSFGPLSFTMDSVSDDSYYSVTRSLITESAGHASVNKEYQVVRRGDGKTSPAGDSMSETMLRSVRLLIRSLSTLPEHAERHIGSIDTTTLRSVSEAAIRNAGIAVQLYWQADTASLQPGGMRVEDESQEGFSLYARAYQGALFSRLSGAMAFSAFLLCLTLLAFGMTYRALRSQIQLAGIRNDLISNMSHELKTPVSTVKVALEALSEPEVLQNTPLAADYLQMAGLELNRLELLVNQALQSALLEEGRMQIERRPLDLGTLAAQMLRAMQGRFQQQGGSVRLVLEGSDFMIPGDALHLQGVIVNMLDNALKYAGPDPSAIVTLRELPGAISIAVEDAGPGIPAQYHAKVFDKFFRVPRGNEHSVKGYGLGLNYAAWVVREHGGTIGVSGRPSGGTRFEIILPKPAL